MDYDLAILVTHGMGSQSAGFADGLITEVNRRINRARLNPHRIAWKPVFWADITEQRQQEYIRRARADSKYQWKRTRDFVVSAFGDASAYQDSPGAGTYEAIHQRIAQGMQALYEELDEKPVPLVVVAHSLGSHIMSNYIWDAHRKNEHMVTTLTGAPPFLRMEWLTGFVTFGSNIPLFTFAFDKVMPISVPHPRLKPELKAKAKWLNFYDPDDVLGYPLEPINADYRDLVEDHPIEVGWASGTPLSHTQYWTDNDFTKPVADYVETLLA